MKEQQQFWFPAKKYGWGWGLPLTWQGWAVLLGFVALLAVGVLVFPPARHHLAFLFYTLVLVAGLVVVCYVKGEPPSWHWGE